MKKVIALILALGMIFCFTACGLNETTYKFGDIFALSNVLESNEIPIEFRYSIAQKCNGEVIQNTPKVYSISSVACLEATKGVPINYVANEYKEEFSGNDSVQYAYKFNESLDYKYLAEIIDRYTEALKEKYNPSLASWKDYNDEDLTIFWNKDNKNNSLYYEARTNKYLVEYGVWHNDKETPGIYVTITETPKND